MARGESDPLGLFEVSRSFVVEQQERKEAEGQERPWKSAIYFSVSYKGCSDVAQVTVAMLILQPASNTYMYDYVCGSMTCFLIFPVYVTDKLKI